jgi:hypothetical protein
LNGHFSSADPLYLEQIQDLTHALAPQVGESHAGQMAVSMLAQNLHQQSTLIASMEYFWAVIAVASLALVVSKTQKAFK